MSLGIDIGKYSVKIVELEQSGDQTKIKKIGEKNLFDDLTKYNHDKITASQISACIQDLCNEMNIKPKKIKTLTSSLSGKSIDVRQVTTLEMPDNELLVSLELEAKKHVPLDGTDAVIDYHLLGNNEEKLDQINLILTTTTKNKISEHAEILKNCGFKPGIFDADPVAMSNIYQYNHEMPEQGSDVLINIGNSSTTLIVWGEKSDFFTREIEISGDHITKEIVRKFGCNYLEAEQKKIKEGINVLNDAPINNETNEDSENEPTNSGIMIEERTIFNDLVEEIRKTLRFYMKNNNNSFFNTFYILGGSSNMPGLNEFIINNLNVKVEFLDPMKNISNDIKIENPLKYSIALGLALRGLQK